MQGSRLLQGLQCAYEQQQYLAALALCWGAPAVSASALTASVLLRLCMHTLYRSHVASLAVLRLTLCI